MRLTPFQVATIRAVLFKYFGDSACLWLFGSRARDNERGGDIDLYLETDIQSIDEIVEAKLRSLAAIKLKIGDQKIDLVIHRRGQPMEIIHKEARKTGIQL